MITSERNSLWLFGELQEYAVFKELKKQLLAKFPDQEDQACETAMELIVSPPGGIDLHTLAQEHDLTAIDVLTIKTIVDGIKDKDTEELAMFG